MLCRAAGVAPLLGCGSLKSNADVLNRRRFPNDRGQHPLNALEHSF
jgi:hypothetical protein